MSQQETKNKKRAYQIGSIYTPTPSSIVRKKDGQTIESFESRRQARLNRQRVCDERGIKTYDTIIRKDG